MSIGHASGTIQCIACGKRFTRGERRYNSVRYKGHYCRQHDGKE